MDVMEQEATEDFEKMAAMLPSEKPYLKTGVFQLARNRIPWLMILMLSSMVTGGILLKYENAFSVIPLLVTFIPMLMDTGGNSGSQASTMIIRGMAVSYTHLMIWKDSSLILRMRRRSSKSRGLILRGWQIIWDSTRKRFRTRSR